MRSLEDLDNVPPSKWTDDEAFLHLSATFAEAVRDHHDLMEPYLILLGDALGDAGRMSVMRRGLRETIRQRHPLPARTAAAEAAE